MMSLSPSRKLHSVIPEDSLSFAWSFKPILFWIRVVMGIELNPASTYHSVGSYFYSILALNSLGFLALVYTMSINILAAIFMFESTSNDLLKEKGFNILTNITRSNLMIIRITAFNELLFNVTIYLVFYAAVLMGVWKPLWSTLQQLQTESPKFDREFYRRCRKITLTGMLCILTVCYDTQTKQTAMISSALILLYLFH